MKDNDMDWLLSRDDTFRYQFLDRLRSDCEYFLGYGNRKPGILFAGNTEDHIEAMKTLWKSFPKEGKPEWLPWKQIEKYAVDMAAK